MKRSILGCSLHMRAHYAPRHKPTHTATASPMPTFEEIEGHEVIVRCPFSECNARTIKLSADATKHVSVIENAPEMLADGTRFFAVKDVWDFDNIGVSKASAEIGKKLTSQRQPIEDTPTTGSDSAHLAADESGLVPAQNPPQVGVLETVERLLICAECDRGPLGFAGFVQGSGHSVQDLHYYLSAESVKYEILH